MGTVILLLSKEIYKYMSQCKYIILTLFINISMFTISMLLAQFCCSLFCKLDSNVTASPKILFCSVQFSIKDVDKKCYKSACIYLLFFYGTGYVIDFLNPQIVLYNSMYVDTMLYLTYACNYNRDILLVLAYMIYVLHEMVIFFFIDNPQCISLCCAPYIVLSTLSIQLQLLKFASETYLFH